MNTFDANTICIYHGNCADGFAAAWAVYERFRRDEQNIDFHAGVYGEDPPDVTHKRVLIVDFSYSLTILNTMAMVAKDVLVLDHHKTAAAELDGIAGPSSWSAWADGDFPGKLGVVFDMDRSGAGITWDFFFPETNKTRPPLIDHIEDRDLWRFKLEGTREIHSTLTSYPYDFDTWTALMDTDPMLLINDGTAIERKHFKDIEELLAVCERTMIIHSWAVPVASLPYTMSSDAGHMMCQGEPFAACYIDTAKGRIFSLRSDSNGIDVSEIAKQYGGGGHKHAAGFEVPRDHPLAQS